MGMKIDQILKEIESLSHSQGFWGRLLRDMMECKEENPDAWEKYAAELEAEEFETTLDMVLFFEEGKHCKRKMIQVPITWQCYGWVEVPASTPEEAIQYLKDHEEEISLPDDWDYVDGSFGLSGPEGEAIEMIKYKNNLKDGD